MRSFLALGEAVNCGFRKGRIQDGDQRFEVAALDGREKCVDHAALLPQDRVRCRRPDLDTPTGATRELACGGDRAIHDRRDLLEGHPKHIVQHERESFRRLQFLENDEERQTDRVGEHTIRFGSFGPASERADDRIRHMNFKRILPARGARAQHVEAHPRNDRPQPSPQVFHTAHVRAAQSDPGFLHGVLGLADGAKHAIGDRPDVSSVLFESLRQALGRGHVAFLSRSGRKLKEHVPTRQSPTNPRRTM